MRFSIAYLIILCLTSLSTYGQDSTQLSSAELYKKGIQEYESKNYKAAVDHILKAAELGNPDAQAKAGNLFMNGEQVNQDYGLALSWYRKAAAFGNVDAIDNLGWMFEYGKGVPQDYIEASNWFKKSSEIGSAYGQYHLGIFYKNGKGVVQDYGEALRLFQKSAEQGNSTGQFYLGVMLDFGYGIAENDGQAIRWYQKAAAQGMVDAQYNLGLLYEDGSGTKQDYSEAARWFNQAAQQGEIKAKYHLALLYQEGNGVEKNLATAIHLYREGAEKGYLKAQSQLGYCLVFGDSILRDLPEGIRWLKKAAEQGYFRAQFNLGQCYSSGTGVKENKNEAFSWIKKSADQDFARAQVELGAMYYAGMGTEKNIVEAVKLFKKAADQGNKTAQKNLWIIYENKEIKQKIGVPGIDSLLFLPLKYELSTTDRLTIREKANSCFEILSNFSFNVTIGDLLPNSKMTAEGPASQRRVEELLKQLGANPNNFNTCLSLGDVYLKLHKRDEGYKYLDKAESIATSALATNPTDYSQYLNLVYVYMKKESYAKALEELEVYSKKNPIDPNTSEIESLCYFGTGDLNKLGEFGKSKIDKDPHDANGYLAISFQELAKVMSTETSDVRSKTIEELADLSLLSNAVKKYPNDFKLKFLLQTLRHMILLLKIAKGLQDSNDPGFTKGFQLTDYDKNEIKRLESFYLSSLSTKGVESKFLANKLLAGLYVLTADYDNAIKFSRISIDIKAHEISFYGSNASELYDLMSTIYLLKKDTLTAEKIVLEKISKEKESYQSADDYCIVARFELWKKNLAEAERSCKLALEIDPITQDAFVGLAAIAILKGDPKTAKDYLLKASSCGQDNAEIKTLNGIVWMEADDNKSAYQSFSEALELNKNAETPKAILKHYFANKYY